MLLVVVSLAIAPIRTPLIFRPLNCLPVSLTIFPFSLCSNSFMVLYFTYISWSAASESFFIYSLIFWCSFKSIVELSTLTKSKIDLAYHELLHFANISSYSYSKLPFFGNIAEVKPSLDRMVWSKILKSSFWLLLNMIEESEVITSNPYRLVCSISDSMF